MKVIVPLAGPDFEREDGQVKAGIQVDGAPLLRRALESRPWWMQKHINTDDIVFVLKDSAVSRAFHGEQLSVWYPAARAVFLSDYSNGAAMSALAGLALVGHARETICIDLADIIYEGVVAPDAAFSDCSVGALGLVFPSSNPLYSYFRTEQSGRVVEVAEKRVISNNASAGTYFFSGPEMYLRGLAANLRNFDRVAHQGCLFVCPVMQGLIECGVNVALSNVTAVRDIKVDFMMNGGAPHVSLV
jgi:hypothetical protein